MDTKVVNINIDPYDVYIGRPSKWGNPFKEGKDGTRKGVLRKYREWLLLNDRLLTMVMDLDGKILGCHCKPKDCHGDVIVSVIKSLKNWEKNKFFFKEDNDDTKVRSS